MDWTRVCVLSAITLVCALIEVVSSGLDPCVCVISHLSKSLHVLTFCHVFLTFPKILEGVPYCHFLHLTLTVQPTRTGHDNL